MLGTGMGGIRGEGPRAEPGLKAALRGPPGASCCLLLKCPAQALQTWHRARAQWALEGQWWLRSHLFRGCGQGCHWSAGCSALITCQGDVGGDSPSRQRIPCDTLRLSGMRHAEPSAQGQVLRISEFLKSGPLVPDSAAPWRRQELREVVTGGRKGWQGQSRAPRHSAQAAGSRATPHCLNPRGP